MNKKEIPNAFENRMGGLLFGTAAGDAAGLPYENLSRRRVSAFLGAPASVNGETIGYSFIPWIGGGMISNDTEHAVLACQAMIREPRSVAGFTKCLARGVRWWIVSVPPGIGGATLRSALKMWIGFGPARSGVWSAGNGPCMRAPAIGGFMHASPELRRDFVRASTRMTHTDPRAEIAAQALARMAAAVVSGRFDGQPPWGEICPDLDAAPGDVEFCTEDAAAEWRGAMDTLGRAALNPGCPLSVQGAADLLGCQEGISGYALHSAPVAIYAWWRHFGDLGLTVDRCVRLGGDTDSVAAIAGALAGATVGRAEIPAGLVAGIIDAPRGISLLSQIADRMRRPSVDGVGSDPVSYSLLLLPLRNIVMTLLIMMHVIRRAFPPYSPQAAR